MRVVVKRITYHNDENGYSILSCCDKNKEKGPSEPFKVVGYIADINAGSELLCEGDWKIDPKYGMQFAATKLEEVLPETKEGIIKYLASGLIKGIGPSYAKRIVDVFGEETFGDGKIKPSEVKTLGKKKSDSDVGEMLLFNPTAEKNKSYSTEEINQNFYENLGVDYVLKCNILGLGIIHNEINSGITPGFGIGIGSRHHSYFDFGIFSSIGTSIKRNSYGVAANMELIKVDGALNIWKRNALGQSSKHRKPSKGYDDASDEAYLKSLNKTADIIVEKVASYSGRFLIKNPDAEENSKTKR